MFITVIIAFIFSILATAIMSYISMATSMGPWIESTLVLFGIIIFRGLLYQRDQTKNNQSIGFTAIAGGLGGIIAVACGWTIPTLYFLQPFIFQSWLQRPYYFISIIALIVLVAGALGFLIAHFLEHHLLDELQISFPIGELVHKMIFAQQQTAQTIKLLYGASTTMMLAIGQQWFSSAKRAITLIPSLSYGIFHLQPIFLRFDLLPLFLSIGFVTGHVIALPLLFGLVAKIIMIEPIQRYFFSSITSEAFLNSFISGLVLQGAVISLWQWPRTIFNIIKQAQQNNIMATLKASITFHRVSHIAMGIIGCIVFSLSLSYFNFSFVAQLYLIFFTIICTYQVLLIAGKTGLAPFPRFATFVLLPGMIIFNFNALQIMVISAFVEICCAVAVDIMFGRKMAKLSHFDHHKTILFQLFGYVTSALSAGIIFYILIKKFSLGSAELCAQRAQARALLIHTKDFNTTIALLGALFGYTLTFVHMNYLLVIGSLLMQPELSLCLIMGGLLTYMVRDKEAWYPFWSGIFAANSLLMIIRAFW